MYENGYNNYVMFMFIQLLGKYQVKDMNMYIEPLIDELLKLWNGFTMYDISRPIGHWKFSIPCNACMDNTWCPWANSFLRYVILLRSHIFGLL